MAGSHRKDKIKGFKKVILAFDNDEAGQDFTYKAAQELIKHKIPFGCVTMLTKDVAEHYETVGNLTAILNSVRSGYKWLLNYITPKVPFDELTVGEKEKAMAKCKEFVESIAPHTKHTEIHDILMSLKAYFPKDWISGLLELSRKGPNQVDVVDKIRSAHTLMYNPCIGFYEYQDPQKTSENRGIWKQVDNEVVMGYAQDRLGRHANIAKVSSILRLLQYHREI